MVHCSKQYDLYTVNQIVIREAKAFSIGLYMEDSSYQSSDSIVLGLS